MSLPSQELQASLSSIGLTPAAAASELELPSPPARRPGDGTPVSAARATVAKGFWFNEVDTMLGQGSLSLTQIADRAERELAGRRRPGVRTLVEEVVADSADAATELVALYNVSTVAAREVDGASGARGVRALAAVARLQQGVARAAWLHRSVQQHLDGWQADASSRENALERMERLMNAATSFYRAEVARLSGAERLRACFTALRSAGAERRRRLLGAVPQAGWLPSGFVAVVLEVAAWPAIAHALPGTAGFNTQLRALRLAWSVANDLLTRHGGYLARDPGIAEQRAESGGAEPSDGSDESRFATPRSRPALLAYSPGTAPAEPQPRRRSSLFQLEAAAAVPQWSAALPSAAVAARALAELPARLARAAWDDEILAASSGVAGCTAEWVQGLQLCAGVAAGGIEVSGAGVLCGPAVHIARHICKAARCSEAAFDAATFAEARSCGALVGVAAWRLPPWPTPRVVTGGATAPLAASARTEVRVYAVAPLALRDSLPVRPRPPRASTRASVATADDRRSSATTAAQDQAHGGAAVLLSQAEEEAVAAVSEAEARLEERTAELAEALAGAGRLEAQLAQLRKDRERLERQLHKALAEIERRDRDDAVAGRERAALQRHRMRFRDSVGSGTPGSVHAAAAQQQETSPSPPRSCAASDAFSRRSTCRGLGSRRGSEHTSPPLGSPVNDSGAPRAAWRRRHSLPSGRRKSELGLSQRRQRAACSTLGPSPDTSDAERAALCDVAPLLGLGTAALSTMDEGEPRTPLPCGTEEGSPASQLPVAVFRSDSERKSVSKGSASIDGPWMTPHGSPLPPQVSPASDGPVELAIPAAGPQGDGQQAAEEQKPRRSSAGGSTSPIAPMVSFAPASGPRRASSVRRRRPGRAASAAVAPARRGSVAGQHAAPQGRRRRLRSAPHVQPRRGSKQEEGAALAPRLVDAATQVEQGDIADAFGPLGALLWDQDTLIADLHAAEAHGGNAAARRKLKEAIAGRLRALRQRLAEQLRIGDECLAFSIGRRLVRARGVVCGQPGPGRVIVRFGRPHGKMPVDCADLEPYPAASPEGEEPLSPSSPTPCSSHPVSPPKGRPKPPAATAPVWGRQPDATPARGRQPDSPPGWGPQTAGSPLSFPSQSYASALSGNLPPEGEEPGAPPGPGGARLAAAVGAQVCVVASLLDPEYTLWYAGHVWQMHRKVQRYHCLLVSWLRDPIGFNLRAEWAALPCSRPSPEALSLSSEAGYGRAALTRSARRRRRIADALIHHQGSRALTSLEKEAAARAAGDLSAALDSVEGLLARCCAALTRRLVEAGDAAPGSPFRTPSPSRRPAVTDPDAVAAAAAPPSPPALSEVPPPLSATTTPRSGGRRSGPRPNRLMLAGSPGLPRAIYRIPV
eukprot:TRINITY_DN11452_c0_g2_i1.p1 TRINITY_DN11452_c0_g2~~TRINITY_DN11452_c0_g2_i1.p1  ORF type:complete len:1462 (+),score=297.21 TRINITY_DN11452_c0_g2_i1:243-4388(+)